jgi:hypothetical protein
MLEPPRRRCHAQVEFADPTPGIVEDPIPLLEWAILASLTGFVALCAVFLARGETTARVFWAAGWICAGAGLLLASLHAEYRWLSLAGFPLGTLFPALLLAGALGMHQRRAPTWLFLAALALGAVRAFFAARGQTELVYGLALAFETPVIL